LLRLAIKKFLIMCAVVALCSGYLPAQQAQQKAAAKPSKHAHRHGKRRGSWKKKGQQAIKPERAVEIQQALIRERYLTGEPSGVWDARTQAALVKYQGDNGWQTKVVPDSRALIKLGLGPDYSSQTLLNGQSGAPTPGATSTAASRSIGGTRDKQ
jgi:putative peptidoglycan binding protein